MRAIGTLHAGLLTSLPTLHCALPTYHCAYLHVPLKSDHDHKTLVPFQQSIVIGVVAVALFALHVRLTSYPLVVVTGAVPVIVLHVGLVSSKVTVLHTLPVVTHSTELGY